MDTRSCSKRKLADIEEFGVKSEYNSNTSTSSQVSQGTSGRLCKKEKCLREEEKANEADSDFESLPAVPLRILFNKLSVPDLTNAQFICDPWADVAKDPNVWKNKTWVLQENARVDNLFKQDLVNSPLIQRIVVPPVIHYNLNGKTCSSNAEVIETVMLHVKDLHAFKISDLPLNLTLKLIKKYRNLESVRIGIHPTNVIKVLKALAPCKKLKQLQFVYVLSFVDLFVLERNFASKVTKLLCKSFLSLKSLDLTYFQCFLPHRCIMSILARKRWQLDHLQLQYNSKSNPEILEMVSKCSDLNLVLLIFCDGTLNLKLLKDVKSLRMKVAGLNGIYLPSLLSFHLHLPNVDYFSVTFANCPVSYRPAGILKHIISAFPNLRSLEMGYINDSDIDEQLAQLNTLNRLEFLHISNCVNLTAKGLSHLSKCPSLKILQLSAMNLCKDSVVHLAKFPKLHTLKLHSCICVQAHLLFLIESSQCLRCLQLHDCHNVNHSKNLLSNVIKQKCYQHGIQFENELALSDFSPFSKFSLHL